MAIKGIHHFAVHTAGLDRMVKFYREAFGFELSGNEYRWENNPRIDEAIDVPGSAARRVLMVAGNVYLELFEYSQPSSGNAVPLRPFDRGYTHFAVETDDVVADYERLLTAGMTFPHTLKGTNAVYGKDPDGNIIEVMQAGGGRVPSLGSLPWVKSARCQSSDTDLSG